MTSPNENPAIEKSGGRARRGVAAGLAVGLLGGTAAGLVFGVPGLTSAAPVVEQTEPVDTPGTTDAPTPADAPDAPPADAGEHLREALQPLVDDGTITAAQAEAVTQQLLESRPERAGGEGRGPGGHRRGPGLFGRGVASEALTDLLGIDVQELRTELREGSTLAEIATAHGIEPQAVIDELVAEVTERTNAAVESGRIDQEKADELLADVTARITDMVDNLWPEHD